jgi:50S ribosomal subunit-associated GTPase HflX
MIHIVDAAGTEGRDPIADIHAINKELEAYNPELLKKPQVIAANKTDAIYGDENEITVFNNLVKEFNELYDGVMEVKYDVKDNSKYKEPVFVGVNGETWAIERGVRVPVPRKVAEVLDNSDKQDYETSVLIENKQKEYEKVAQAFA